MGCNPIVSSGVTSVRPLVRRNAVGPAFKPTNPLLRNSRIRSVSKRSCSEALLGVSQSGGSISGCRMPAAKEETEAEGGRKKANHFPFGRSTIECG